MLTAVGVTARRRRALPSTEHEQIPATIAIPAYNEAETVVQSVTAVLSQSYPVSVVVVDDGSTDGTFEALSDQFTLRAVNGNRTRFEAVADPLTVIRQENMGKAAALNTALEQCPTPLFGVVDADTIVESGYLAALSAPFDDVATVATGGSFRVVDTETVAGASGSPSLPKSWFQRFQALGYLKGLFRQLGRQRLGAMVAPPGAASLFRTELLRAVDGFDDVKTEDFEVAIQLQRHCAEIGREAAVVQAPDAIAWTTVPTTTGALDRQRQRWVRGILATLFRHRAIVGRPKYGRVATVGLPHLLFGELLWRLSVGIGVFIVALAFLTGAIPVLLVVLFVAGLLVAGPVTAGLAVVGTRGEPRGYDAADRRALFVTAAIAWVLWRPLLTFLELLNGIGKLRRRE